MIGWMCLCVCAEGLCRMQKIVLSHDPRQRHVDRLSTRAAPSMFSRLGTPRLPLRDTVFVPSTAVEVHCALAAVWLLPL